MRPYLSRTIVALLGVLALAAGCAQRTGSLTKVPASFLVFVGDTANAKVTVDERPFELTKENSKNHFEVSPGVHRVKIEKQGRVVVDREILLSDRQTMEVAIP
ncbi:MAG: hypothetical protein Q8N18_10850 [Opitutaceae bacterium]|nr:hypothetical protein [Opitutaceae bacterium]